MEWWTNPDRRVAWVAALVLAVGLSLFISLVVYGYTGPLETDAAPAAERPGRPADPEPVNRTGVGELPRSGLGEVGNTAVIGGGLLAITACLLYASRPERQGRPPDVSRD